MMNLLKVKPASAGGRLTAWQNACKVVMGFWIAVLCDNRSGFRTQTKRSVCDLGLQIRPGFGLARIPVSAFFACGGDIFVDPVITFHQLGKAQIFEVAVSLGGIDCDQGNQPLHLLAAIGAAGEFVTVY
jgi:hypothetical protein